MTDAAAASAQPFSAKAVALMILVGVFAFAAFVVLSAYAPDLRSGRDGRAHALSKSAVGFAGLVALAKAVGTPVVVSRSGVGPASPGGAALILTPAMGGDAKKLAGLIDRAGARHILVIMPKWQVTPAVDHPGWVAEAGVVPLRALSSTISLPGGAVTLHRRDGTAPVVATFTNTETPEVADIGPIDRLQTLQGAGWAPLMVDQHGRWITARSKAKPNLFILAEPDLLNNQGLANAKRAEMVVITLDGMRAEAGVVFDVSLNGFERSRGVLKLAFEPPFLAATLCAVAAALLMGLHAAARFGAPRAPARAFALGKRALADNSAALLRLARREPSMAQPYADLTRQAVARAVGAPRRLDKAELDAVIDRLAAKAGRSPDAARLSAEAARVSDIGGLMAVARKLYDFRRGMTRERD